MISCKICDDVAKFETVDQLYEHTKAVHGFAMPDVLARETIHVSRDDLYLINRALSIAAAVYSTDSIALTKLNDPVAAMGCIKTAREMRTLLERLENR